MFKLFVAWKPTGKAYLTTAKTVLEATIGQVSAKDDRYHVSSFGADAPLPASLEARLARALLSKKAEQCEVLENGHLQLVSPQ